MSRDITWRWRRDLNPRWACTHKRFRGVLLRPLGHATAGKATGRRRCAPKSAVAWRRTPSSRAVLSAASTPRDDLGTVVEPAVADDVPERPDGTGLVVVRPEDEAVHPRQHQRAGAHRARLEGHDQGAAGEPPLPDGRGGRAQRDHLGVAGRVAVALADVAARSRSPRRRRRAPRRRWVRRRSRSPPREVEGRPHRCLPAGHRARPELTPRGRRSSSNLAPKPTLSATSLRISSG